MNYSKKKTSCLHQNSLNEYNLLNMKQLHVKQFLLNIYQYDLN